mgnify:CR=1 FL=1
MTAKASIFTHGCRLNQAESALIADDLQQAGYKIVPWNNDAEVLVINSCVVTSKAARKARQTANSARRENPHSLIVLTGCGAENIDDRIADEKVFDLAVANKNKRSIPSAVRNFLSPREADYSADISDPSVHDLFTEPGCGYYSERTRANIKIQEGCDSFCSYCIVPLTRGNPRSRQWEDVIREAQMLVSRGHRELVLTGVNIALYNDNGRTLTDLLYKLQELDGDFRIRLSSTEPCAELTPIINAVKDLPRVCRFLHIPMQYGSDKVLKSMNRRYTAKECSRFIQYAADKVPDICIGSDIIVGFPGETEEDFQECLDNIKSLPLAYLHIFRYSPRRGTTAAKYVEHIDGKTVAERRKRLEKTAQKKSEAFTTSMKGKKFRVLTEYKNTAGYWEGWTDNYLRAEISDNYTSLQPNQFIEVIAEEVKPNRRIKVKPESQI